MALAIDKQKLILISGIVLGVVAIVMTKMYLDKQKLETQEKAKKAIATMQANQAAVLVSKNDIAEGSTIEAEMLDSKIVPNQFIQPGAVTSLDRIAGMVTIAPIAKGEQVSLSKLTAARKSGGGNLSGVTPAGKRAITIIVDHISSLSGMVRPGDYVDILAMLQIPMQGADGKMVGQTSVVPLFQNVLVLAVGSDTGGAQMGGGSRYATKETSSTGNVLITLALTPREANLIAFVQEQGKIRLTMRSPADAKTEQMLPTSWEALFQYILPPAPKSNVEPVAKPVDKTEYIDVIRGLRKDKIPLN